MLFHYILNSLIVFFILSSVIELIFLSFKIKNARVRIFLRALPFFKLPFDILIFLLYGESLFINLNPFSCEALIHRFFKDNFFGFFPAELSATERLVIPQYIGMKIPSYWLKSIVIGIVGTSILIFLYKITQYFRSCTILNKILQASLPSKRKIVNTKLKLRLANLGATIVASKETSIPFTAHTRHIVFPEISLQEFSQEEFEAIVAHELEHLYWKDPLLKLYCTFMRALLWWIPTGRWLKKIEEDMENASDAGIGRYGIHPHSLASALVKTITRVRMASSQKFLTPGFAPTCELASRSQSLFVRFNCLLKEKHPTTTISQLKNLLGASLCLFVFISFWTC